MVAILLSASLTSGCTPAEQQQAVIGVQKSAEATHATSELCIAIARNFGAPALEAKCKLAHDASELILANLPAACTLPRDGGHDAAPKNP